jgi:hypothetical protein
MIFDFKNIRNALSNEFQKCSFFVHSRKSMGGRLVDTLWIRSVSHGGPEQPTPYGKYAIASQNQATDAATIVDDFR